MATTTNALVVVRVDEGGVTVAVNGENRRVAWDDLRAAAGQADRELAAAYKGVLREAEGVASRGPVEVGAHRDSTNVWWVVTVRAALGGGPADWHRHADEGGTHARHSAAAFEAEGICRRLGKRVRSRTGF
jgi:hypothetical protein